MGKNIEMLKCFMKVMRGDSLETIKVIPDMYQESIYTIDEDYLLRIGINKLILDIDGTLLPADDIYVPEKLIDRIKTFRNKQFSICLVSNNGKDRVEPVAKALGLLDSYLASACKPLPSAFDKALEILDGDKKNVAMVGDQMMSDVKGANEYGIYSILVKPISNHNNIQTKTSRFLQNKMEKHLKKMGMFDHEIFYKKKGEVIK